MKKWMDKILLEFKKFKRAYVFLGILLLVGIITGTFFMSMLDKSDKLLVTNQLTEFFKALDNLNKVNFIDSLKSCLLGNTLSILGIWILGISIIGIPVVLFYTYFRGFVVGFSIGSIFYLYKWKGIIVGFLYIFPHQIINLLLLLVLARYAIVFSINLFYAITNKKGIKLHDLMRHYLKILFIAIGTIVLTSLFEVFVTPYLLKLIKVIL